jgi:LPS sulfotransferase NodH
MLPPVRLPASVTRSFHARKLRPYFGGSLVSTFMMPDDVRFAFLCFSNRCGSNYLADLLASTGELNLASEAMNWDETIRVCDENAIYSFHEYLYGIARHNMRSGWFLTKLSTFYLPLLRETGLLPRCFAGARFIHVRREDRLAQAISLEIALQTEQWASDQAVAIAPGALQFRPEKIAEHVAEIARQNREFAELFALNGIAATTVRYEDLVADPAGTVAGLAPVFGLERLAADLSRVRLVKQAGAINRDWWERCPASLR